MNWAPIRPKRGIFNVFEKGKDFFYIRAGIEALLLVYLMVVTGAIVTQAMGIYPTVVRDHRSQTYVGVPSRYETTPDEMLQFIASTVEVLYLRTNAGTTTTLLKSTVAQPIREAIVAAQPSAGGAGYIQTATVTRVLPNKSTSTHVTAYVQVEFELNNFERVLVDAGYFNARLTRGAPTQDNPSGWVLTDWVEVPKEFYLREQTRLMPDPDGATEPTAKEQQLISIEY